MTPHRNPGELEAHASEIHATVTGVVSHDVLPEDPRTQTHAVEFIVGPEGNGAYHHVPPRVLDALADADLGLWDATRRGDGYFVVVAV